MKKYLLYIIAIFLISSCNKSDFLDKVNFQKFLLAGSGNYEKFDAIIASYHDQGLIPFKTLSFGKGVNYTAGLNKIRTSPDHGTAFDIAGKNIAHFESTKQAILSAIQFAVNKA